MIRVATLSERPLACARYDDVVGSDCPFCDVDRDLLGESPLALAFEDDDPVSPGHALVIPRRHVETYYGCTADEKAAIWSLVDRISAMIAVMHHPDGFSVGFNAGIAAGQTVLHAHIHVIPRYAGDVADPRGGVRHAMVGRGHSAPKP